MTCERTAKEAACCTYLKLLASTCNFDFAAYASGEMEPAHRVNAARTAGGRSAAAAWLASETGGPDRAANGPAAPADSRT